MRGDDPGRCPESRYFRLALWIVERASSLVPWERRDSWKSAWIGEIWHRARSLERAGGGDARLGLELVRRSLGAFSHSAFLAVREWKLPFHRRDVVHGLRSLRSRPGFTAIALLTLALGIGANTFLFGLVEGVLLHPFPYRDVDRLLAFESSFPKLSADAEFVESISMPDFREIEKEARSITSLLAFDMGNRDLGGVGEPQRLLTAAFLGDAFDTLGMPPALGRGFTREEIERNEPVAIVSYRVFQEHLGGDPSLVGGSILVNGAPRTLVGVMPPRLLLLDTDLWLPMWYEGEDPPRTRRFLTVLARLREGASLEEARAEIDLLARRIEEEGKKEAPEYEGFRLTVRPFVEVWSSFVGPAGYLLMGAAGLALAIACGNIAGLLLARGASRRHEIAVRSALGASRSRLVGHLLVEALLLAAGGGAIAVVLAHLALQATIRLVPSALPLMGIELEVDGAVLAFATGISLASALLFALAPALQSARLAVPANLAPETRSFGIAGAVRLRRVFVAAQIAASMVLLMGSALLLRSFDRLSSVDPGIPIENVLTMRVTLPWERYEGEVHDFYDRWSMEVNELPGVRSGGLITQFPPMVFMKTKLARDRMSEGGSGELAWAYDTIASPGIFETLGVRLVAGRVFDHRDRQDQPPVAVVNETFARRYFSGEDPLGRRVFVGEDEAEGLWLTIVGVVSDARNQGVDHEPAPEIWSSYRQRPQWVNQMHLLVRTDGDPRALLPAVRESLRSLDPLLPIYAVQTLEERFDAVVFTRRLASRLMAVLGLLSLLLAAMGLYGVIAFTVAAKRRELGLRVALGADSGRILGHVLGEASRLVATGVAVGALGSLALGRFVAGFLYEVEAGDPLLFAATIATISLVSLGAAFLPARRATRLSPLDSLR